MRTTSLFFLCILLPVLASSQWYIDASNMLPNNGATSAAMDVRAFDLEGDGDLDIVLANEFEPNTLLANDGLGAFNNVTMGNLPQSTHDSEDVAIADFNGDGYLDLVFCSEDDVNFGWTDVHEYYLGNETGGFSESPYSLVDSEANAVISSDINGDGFPDLIFGNNGVNHLLLNKGDGDFTLAEDQMPSIQRTTQDLALIDVNGDGYLDLFEGNENGNVLHINDGNGFFTDETSDRLPSGLNIETRKVSAGDIDSDGDLDIFLANVEFIVGKDRQNRLLLNDGNGFFTDVTTSQLPTDNDLSIDAIFEDVDDDGDLDLFVCNVFGSPLKVYLNDGQGLFTDNTFDILGQFYFRDALGVIAEDFNGNGFTDFYVCDRRNPNSPNKDLLLLRSIFISNEDTPAKEPSLVISPNPASESIQVSVRNATLSSLHILNVSGARVHSRNALDSNTLFVSTQDFPKGHYIVSVTTSLGETMSQKIVLD